MRVFALKNPIKIVDEDFKQKCVTCNFDSDKDKV